MAKKEKIPSTPESRAKKLEDKKEVRTAFRKTFFPALAICLSVLLIYSVIYISFFRPKEQTIEGDGRAVNTNTNTVIVDNGGSSSSNSAAPVDNGNSAAPANNGNSAAPADNGNSAAPADNNGGSAAPADNSAEAILNEFNTAINKVKTESSAITHVSGGTKNNGGIDPSSQLPGILKTVGNSVIDTAMSSNGVKEDGSVIDKTKFPVENTNYCSQLTMDDIVSATKSGNTITIVIKDDELGQADNGHAAKAMNVIKAATIMENIPSVASSIASEAKTSAKGGTIVVELDGNGHVVKADYSFSWDIEILGNNLDAIIHLASEEHYAIAY